MSIPLQWNVTSADVAALIHYWQRRNRRDTTVADSTTSNNGSALGSLRLHPPSHQAETSAAGGSSSCNLCRGTGFRCGDGRSARDPSVVSGDGSSGARQQQPPRRPTVSWC